jgi:hypothetical protein
MSCFDIFQATVVSNTKMLACACVLQAAANPEAKKGRGGPRKTGSKANLSGMEAGPAGASTGGPAASGGPADSGSGRKRGRTSMGATS